MPDIAMCTKRDCPNSQRCYRFMATPSQRQSYLVPTPLPDGSCTDFIPVAAELPPARVVKASKP